MSWQTLALSVGIALVVFAILHQTDRALWYQACLIKSAGTHMDSDKLIRAGNTFFLWWKVIPALLTTFTFVMSMVTHRPIWLIIFGLCLVFFMAASLVGAIKKVTYVSQKVEANDKGLR
jgi:hypothetical protein